MQVGFASIDITPDRLLNLQGQMHARLATHTRDPLMASAIAFADGEQKLVVVSCDIFMMTDDFVAAVRSAVAPLPVLLAATHTHVGPGTVEFFAEQPADAAFMEQFRQKLIRVVGKAADNLEEATLYASGGWIEHMGWNRRGLHRDGTVDMYHGSWREDFAGVEGPRDGDVPVITAHRADGSIKAILTGFATHSNCCESEHFYSADIPGAVRDVLHKVLGSDVGVVYLTGAAGNTAPSVMENNPKNHQPWRKEEGLVRSGRYLGAEILKTLAAQVDPMPSQSLAVASRTLSIPLRPWPESFVPEVRTKPGPGREYFIESRAAWPRFLAEASPCNVNLHVVRLGEVALCTNPAELYVEHALAIKKDSPAAMTMIAQLTDGYCGYVPTVPAFKRGGYSTWPAQTSKLAEDAGDQIVAATKELLGAVFVS